jgi:hypothetical protein
MISYCPHCGAQLRWSPPRDTIVCGGCGEWWYTEFLLDHPPPLRENSEDT